MIHPPCRNGGIDADDIGWSCGHGWNVHAPNDGKCRVSGCACPAYRETPPAAPLANRAEVLGDVARAVEAGSIVIIVRGGPETVPFAQLALARAILGAPMEGDPGVQFMLVERIDK